MPRISNPFTAELVITPAPSRLLLAFTGLIHLLALGVILIVPGLDTGWRISLAGCVLLSSGYYFYTQGGWWLEKKVEALYWREFGGWELTTGSGQHLPVVLQASSFSHRYLSVLNFKTRKALGSKHYTVVLLPDNSDREIRRRLRMRIKLLLLAGKNKSEEK